jgi:hypothetical protein
MIIIQSKIIAPETINTLFLFVLLIDVLLSYRLEFIESLSFAMISNLGIGNRLFGYCSRFFLLCRLFLLCGHFRFSGCFRGLLAPMLHL